ncbi:MAG TPA: DUF2007 domain-containing protein [Gemmataceae bacterium]|nr:DUF2007 domain-containing protein [Gemmataceae bacterium]
MQGDDIIRLATAADPAEAAAMQEALEEEGIPCKVLGELLDSGFLDPQSARPEVWVHRNDLERAVAAIEAQRRAAAEDAEPEED